MLWLHPSFVQRHETHYVPCLPCLSKSTRYLLPRSVLEPLNQNKLYLASLNSSFFCPSSLAVPLLVSESKDRSLAFVMNIGMKCSDEYIYVCTQRHESPFVIGSVLFSLAFKLQMQLTLPLLDQFSRRLYFSVSMLSWCSIIAFVSEVQGKRTPNARGPHYIHNSRFGWHGRGWGKVGTRVFHW